jgi:hypothetical protein
MNLSHELIRRGMICSPAHGELAFTVPFFDEFMIRAIPKELCYSRVLEPA